MSWPQESSSPIRVQVSDQMTVDGIAVRIAYRLDQQNVRIMHFSEQGYAIWEEVGIAELPKATFSLNHDFARALLDALLRYYNGSGDSRTMREDLLHERGRVDKLVGVVCEIAHDSMVTMLERD